MQAVQQEPGPAARRPPPPPLYRSAAGEQEVRQLYDKALAALPYPHEERLVSTSFGTAHVVVCGPADAPPLVVWHGAGAPAPFMLRLFDTLLLDSRPPFRIYCPDLPYHAGSRSEDAEFDPVQHEHGRWCLELLQGLALVGPSAGHSPPPFHVGTSFGGAVLLDLAVVAPETIRAAALVVPGGLLPVRKLALTLQLLLPSMLYRLLPCPWTARLAMAGLVGPEGQGVDELEEIVLLGFRHVCRWPRSPGGASGFSPDQLRHFTAPTIVIAAEHDFWCPGDVGAAAAQRALPGCRRTVVLAGARHLPSNGRDSDTSRLVVDFFSEVLAQGSQE